MLVGKGALTLWSFLVSIPSYCGATNNNQMPVIKASVLSHNGQTEECCALLYFGYWTQWNLEAWDSLTHRISESKSAMWAYLPKECVCSAYSFSCKVSGFVVGSASSSTCALFVQGTFSEGPSTLGEIVLLLIVFLVLWTPLWNVHSALCTAKRNALPQILHLFVLEEMKVIQVNCSQ